MTLSISAHDLAACKVSSEKAYYIPPRVHLGLVETDFMDTDEICFATWTEILLSLDSLKLEHGGAPQLTLNRIVEDDPGKERAHGKDREGVRINTKILLCTELRRNEFVSFIPPGKYHSIQFGFGNTGASLSGIEIKSNSSSRIIGSRHFLASVTRRTASMVYTPNPETVRRLKKAAGSFASLLRGLKDDLVGVKPAEEIPDGPYTLEEYDIWYSKHCSIGAKEEVVAEYFISTFSLKPLITVVLAIHNADPVMLAATVHSVLDQLYDNFELIISDAGSNSEQTLGYLRQLSDLDPRIKVRSTKDNHDIAMAVNEAVNISRGDYVTFVDQDDLVSRDALFWLVEKINEWPESEMIYSDEDRIDPDNHFVLPHFKSDWNLLLLTSYNYVGHLVMVSSKVAKIVKWRSELKGSPSFDFVLRAALQIDENRIKHVPRILYHQRLAMDSLNIGFTHALDDEPSRYDAIEDFLNSWSPGATVDHNLHSFYSRVHFPVPAHLPQVSVIIPTRDAPEVLERCVNSVMNFTKYPNYKIHIIDNQSVESRTLSLFADLERFDKVEIHHYDKPFNYSDMHNWLISKLDSELICLLNNDTEIVEESWLSELITLVSLPGFAAAGAMLLYPDRTIQHAGVTLGVGGVAAHIGVGDLPDEPNYYSRNLLPQELSAVTAACLLVKRDIYLQVGGMNAARLPISFNDVDLCLKLRAAKYKIAWSPHSKLIHHESKSRGIDHENDFKALRAAGEMSYLALTWRSELMNDPYYNPNFDLKSEPYEKLASVPRLDLTLKPGVKT
ncbi:MAG: glycosyltransferase [Actinomycetota bacterium]|nr:MAG: glycosyltransferase [Actinomycetota bacterium]